MRRLVVSGSILAGLMLLYGVSPLVAWVVLSATVALFAVRHARQPEPTAADR